MEKIQINGVQGKTIFYSFNNIRIDGYYLKFDSFKFYTPKGNLDDGDGYKYFVVPADEISIIRDTIDRTIELRITQNAGVEACIIYPGNTMNEELNNDGDYVCSIYIPADTELDIEVKYKEVC